MGRKRRVLLLNYTSLNHSLPFLPPPSAGTPNFGERDGGGEVSSPLGVKEKKKKEVQSVFDTGF